MSHPLIPDHLLIAGARVLDPESGLDGPGYVGIRDGRIQYVGSTPPEQRYDETLNAAGLWLLPGLVDRSVPPVRP